MFGWTLAFVGDDAGDGGSNSRVAGHAAGFLAHIEDFLFALLHRGDCSAELRTVRVKNQSEMDQQSS